MALKGQQLKTEIAQKILNLFGDNAFFYNDGKEIRINGLEDDQPCQIKITLTATKAAVGKEADTAVSDSIKPTLAAIPKSEMIDFDAPTAPQSVAAPTEQEKITIKELMAKLGL